VPPLHLSPTAPSTLCSVVGSRSVPGLTRVVLACTGCLSGIHERASLDLLGIACQLSLPLTSSSNITVQVDMCLLAACSLQRGLPSGSRQVRPNKWSGPVHRLPPGNHHRCHRELGDNRLRCVLRIADKRGACCVQTGTWMKRITSPLHETNCISQERPTVDTKMASPQAARRTTGATRPSSATPAPLAAPGPASLLGRHTSSAVSGPCMPAFAAQLQRSSFSVVLDAEPVLAVLLPCPVSNVCTPWAPFQCVAMATTGPTPSALAQAAPTAAPTPPRSRQIPPRPHPRPSTPTAVSSALDCGHIMP
jgi:hypothetical protein